LVARAIAWTVRAAAGGAPRVGRTVGGGRGGCGGGAPGSLGLWPRLFRGALPRRGAPPLASRGGFSSRLSLFGLRPRFLRFLRHDLCSDILAFLLRSRNHLGSPSFFRWIGRARQP